MDSERIVLSTNEADSSSDIPFWKIPPKREIVRRQRSWSSRGRLSHYSWLFKECQEDIISSVVEQSSKRRSHSARFSSTSSISSRYNTPDIDFNTTFPSFDDVRDTLPLERKRLQTISSSDESKSRTSNATSRDFSYKYGGGKQKVGQAVEEKEVEPRNASVSRLQRRPQTTPSRLRGLLQESKANNFQTKPVSRKGKKLSEEAKQKDEIGPKATRFSEPETNIYQTENVSGDNESDHDREKDFQNEENADSDDEEPTLCPPSNSPELSDLSDEFDTDCEPSLESEFRREEFQHTAFQVDTDIGHMTYAKACRELSIQPRRLVLQQLWKDKLRMRYAGLLGPEVKAIALALLKNSRLTEVDLSHSGMPGAATTYMFDAIRENSYITKLRLSGNTVDGDSAIACSDMLSQNTCLITLCLSECFIGDDEITEISLGIQDNCKLQYLDLSKNKIGITGGLQLGRALGENRHLHTVDLSWNHIRGGGAVAICNALQKNKHLEELYLSWNGLGFEGSLALGESLKLNRALRKLNIENNRINWDGAPYLARALVVNRALQVLELGHNPISMEGCEELMLAVTKPTSQIKELSLEGIPINTKIALIATEIAKCRPFTVKHGGILSTYDVIGIQRARREDPFSLLIRYLSVMGIRVVDLFRMFDRDSKMFVSRSKFIQGLKRVRAPLNEEDMVKVARRLQSNKRGQISYQELAATVRNRIREDLLEDRRQLIMEKKKREERRRILQSDKAIAAPTNLSSLPTMYIMYGQRERHGSKGNLFSPSIVGSFSRRGSTNFTVLPPIKSSDRSRLGTTSSDRRGSGTASSPLTLIGQDNLGRGLRQSDNPASREGPGRSYIPDRPPTGSHSSYVRQLSQLKRQQTSKDLLGRYRQL